MTLRLGIRGAAPTASRRRVGARFAALIGLALAACSEATPPPGGAQGAGEQAPTPAGRGSQAAAQRVEVPARQQRELIQLGPEGVFGRLLNADGAPAVGARVFLLVDGPDPRRGAVQEVPSKPLAATSALADGRFALPLSIPTAGDGVIWALLPGHADLSAGVGDESGWRDLGVLQLTRGRVVKGSVTKLGSGEPIAHATVRVTPSRAELDAGLRRIPGREDGIVAHTGTDGRFELGPLPVTGKVTFSATASGFSRRLQTGFDLGGEHNQQAHFVLEQGTRLLGSVRHADGAPIAAARIEAWPQDSTLPPLVTYSSEQGAFTLDGLQRLRHYLVRCHADGLRIAILRDVVGGGDQLKIVLRPAAVVKISVVGLEAVGAASARVAVRSATPPDYAEVASGAVTATDGSAIRLEVQTTGLLVVTVEPPGGTVTASAPFELSPGDGERSLSIACQLPGAIAGQVLHARGRPVAAAQVAAVPRPGSLAASIQGRRSTTCDGEGRYRITGLTEGEYTIEARHPACCRSEHANVKITRGADQALASLVLRSGTRVVGSWSRTATAKARLSVLVTPTDTVTSAASTEVLADGRFELGEALPPGSYTLRVYAHDPAGTAKPRLVALTDFEVAAGDDVVTVTPQPR